MGVHSIKLMASSLSVSGSVRTFLLITISAVSFAQMSSLIFSRVVSFT